MSSPDDHSPDDPGYDDEDAEPRGRVDTAAVLYVVGGIPFMIAFFLGLFLMVGACDQMNIPIPA